MHEQIKRYILKTPIINLSMLSIKKFAIYKKSLNLLLKINKFYAPCWNMVTIFQRDNFRFPNDKFRHSYTCIWQPVFFNHSLDNFSVTFPFHFPHRMREKRNLGWQEVGNFESFRTACQASLLTVLVHLTAFSGDILWYSSLD